MNKSLKRSKTLFLSIGLIVLSLIIITASSFAYFTDKTSNNNTLSFGKIDLNNTQTATAASNVSLNDKVPGDQIKWDIKFQKEIASEAMYVRITMKFVAPSDASDTIKNLVTTWNTNASKAANFAPVADTNKGYTLVAGSGEGDVYYLVNRTDTANLYKVDTNDQIVVSGTYTIPTTITQTIDSDRTTVSPYMGSISLEITIQAIQADNVNEKVATTKETFKTYFPTASAQA